MNKRLILKSTFFGFALLAALVFQAATAFSATTDKYAPVYEKPLKASALKDPLSYLLAFPFEVIRWPMSKNLLFVEKHHIDQKMQWAYTYLKEHGITPSVGYSGGEGFEAGLKLDIPRLTDLKTQFPDAIFDTWINFGFGNRFQTGTEIGLEKIAGTDFFISGLAQYERQYQEDFYGVGPDTSKGDGVSYEKETTTLGGKAGYEFSPSLKATTHLKYRNINIGESDDEGKGQMGQFGPNRLNGFSGDRILTMAGELKHDTRDFTDAPTKGGYQQLLLGYNEGLGDSQARYLTYRADIAQYLKVGSPRRIIALRGLMQTQDEVNGGYVPFYDLAKLGGYGNLTQPSETLRSYGTNRFNGNSLLLFNIEYRYAIWQYKELQLDAVPFFDIGQVFNEWSQFQMRDFKESYGLEFRIHVARTGLLNISVAHGDEGTNFFVRTKKAF